VGSSKSDNRGNCGGFRVIVRKNLQRTKNQINTQQTNKYKSIKKTTDIKKESLERVKKQKRLVYIGFKSLLKSPASVQRKPALVQRSIPALVQRPTPASVQRQPPALVQRPTPASVETTTCFSAETNTCFSAETTTCFSAEEKINLLQCRGDN
jgi:hypothetical protein